MNYQSINPYTGLTFKKFDEIDHSTLELLTQTASMAFSVWKNNSYAERAVIVEKVAVLMRTRVEELAQLVTLEMGKRISEARAEVMFSAVIVSIV